MRCERGAPDQETPRSKGPDKDLIHSDSNAVEAGAASPIPDEQFRDWLNERLDQPHRYDLEAELLQAAWSA
jgi:hypothetical protein